MYWETSLAKQGTCGGATGPKCSVEGGDMGESYRRGVAKHCLGMQLTSWLCWERTAPQEKASKPVKGQHLGSLKQLSALLYCFICVTLNIPVKSSYHLYLSSFYNFLLPTSQFNRIVITQGLGHSYSIFLGKSGWKAASRKRTWGCCSTAS